MTKKTVNYPLYVYILDLDDTLYKEIDFVHSAFCHIDRLLVADYGLPAGEGRRFDGKGGGEFCKIHVNSH